MATTATAAKKPRVNKEGRPDLLENPSSQEGVAHCHLFSFQLDQYTLFYV